MTIMFRRTLAVSVIGAALMLLLFPATAGANGRVVRFKRQVAGPYEIALGTIPASPAVGNLHLTITVSDATSKANVPTSEITVSARGPGASEIEIGPVVAQYNPLNPAFFDANTAVDRKGTWEFTVSVRGSLGEATARFPIEVRNSSPIVGIATLLVLLVFLTILGLSVRTYIGGRRSPRKQRCRSAS